MPHWTSHIEKPDALNLPKAAIKSKEIGYPVNLFVTINLEQLGYDTLKCLDQWRTLRQRLKRHLNTIAVPLVCVWVFENSSSNGLHVHCLIHCGKLTKQDIRRALNIDNSTQETVYLGWLHRDKTWEMNINHLVNYFLEGIRPEHAHLITREVKDQGMIPGKRIGWTRNLSPSVS